MATQAQRELMKGWLCPGTTSAKDVFATEGAAFFSSLGANVDGFVTETELAQNGVPADLRCALFAMADADGDGRIRCTWHTTLGRRRPILHRMHWLLTNRWTRSSEAHVGRNFLLFSC